MPPSTPTRRLAEVLLGRPLDEWVRERRAAGSSWRLISMELWDATNHEVVVTYETLRSWFPDETNGDGEAA